MPALSFLDFTDKELVEMRNVFVLYVKLPKSYEPYIKRSEKLDEKGKKLRNKLLMIYDKTVWKNEGWYKDDGCHDKYMAELNAMMKK